MIFAAAPSQSDMLKELARAPGDFAILIWPTFAHLIWPTL
jgi:hypothetical protein